MNRLSVFARVMIGTGIIAGTGTAGYYGGGKLGYPRAGAAAGVTVGIGINYWMSRGYAPPQEPVAS